LFGLRLQALRPGVHKDGIVEYAQVIVHAARDRSTPGFGVGVGGEGAPNLSEVLVRRIERHGPVTRR
jgi:hypothetical protein